MQGGCLVEIISLLPFFIFLLFVIVTIYRTKKKFQDLGKSDRNISKTKRLPLKSEKNEKERKSGWRNILIDAYEQIQREIKTAQEQKQAQYKIPEKDVFIPPPPPIPYSKEIAKKKAAVPSVKSATVKLPEAKIVKSDPAFTEKPTIKNLRKAVVWAEILSPPLALRKNNDL
jgi:hypothetical protein